MGVLATIGLLALTAGLVTWFRRRPADDGPERAETEIAWLSPEDEADLDEAFRQAEFSSVNAALTTRLQRLISRRSPVRTIRRSPGPRSARVGFADGTVILIRADGESLCDLVVRSYRESVCLVESRPAYAGSELVFETSRGPVRAFALGLDQAD